MKNGIRSRSRAELLLAGVITARATSYLFSKLIMQSMSMFNMLGIRFLLAFTLLLILFFKRIRKINRKTFAAGAVMGCLYFLVMTAELNGLKRTSSGNVSFFSRGWFLWNFSLFGKKGSRISGSLRMLFGSEDRVSDFLAYCGRG